MNDNLRPAGTANLSGRRKALSEALVELTGSVYRAGLPHLIASTVLVQGLAYLSQLYIAHLLGPAAFGIVRNAEALISMLVLLGSVGMPSLAVKSVAEVSDPAQRARLLGRLLQIAGLGGVALSATAWLILPAFVPPVTRPYFSRLVWIVALSAFGRTAINYFQGIRQFQRMAAISVTLSALAMTLLALLTWRFGLDGWIFGRYAGEGLFVAGGLLLLKPHIRLTGRLPAPYASGALIRVGATIAMSLVVRTALDNAALLALAYFGRTAEEIGCYGLGSLIITGVMLLPGATATLAITRFVERVATPKVARDYYYRVLRWSLIVIVPCAGALILCSPVLAAIFGSGYVAAVPTLQVLALTLPIRTVAVLTAALLMAHDGNKLTLATNWLFLMLGAALYAIVVPKYGPAGAAWATVLLEAGSAALLAILSRRRLWSA
jgi:O-antigen/teichoic acid export membrane protein